MMNVTKYYNNDVLDNSENSYLYFHLGENNYAIKVQQVMEIMKLPSLDYPQKLANNIIGLLNYNNFTINILDLRFYLNIKVTPYSLSNQLLVVRTDETIFGLIIDKVEDIIFVDPSKAEHFTMTNGEKIIDFLYKNGLDTISIINPTALESLIKTSEFPCDVDIPSLFPSDDESRYKLMQRNFALQEKFTLNLATNIFAQDKFISLLIDGSNYCMNLEYVREFIKDAQITSIPCGLDYIAGIITLRGDFVTVIDTQVFLGFAKSDEVKQKNSVVIVDGPDYTVGFLVDDIFNIIEIPEETIENNTQKRDKYVLSEVVLDDNFYSILNMKEVFSDDRLYIEENF